VSLPHYLSRIPLYQVGPTFEVSVCLLSTARHIHSPEFPPLGQLSSTCRILLSTSCRTIRLSNRPALASTLIKPRPQPILIIPSTSPRWRIILDGAIPGTQISFFQEALEGRRPAYSPASLKSIKIRELEVIPRSLPWVHSFHQPQPAHYSSAAYSTSSIEFSPTFSLSDVLAHAGSYQRGIMNSYHGGVSESSEWTQSLPVRFCYCVVCFC
jgi:hypothetical protein